MRKITLLIVTLFATTYFFAQNLITNGTFDDATGWTVVNHNDASNTFGSVTIAGGVAAFSETSNTDWKHMGIYTSVSLEAGKTYQFDMNMAFTDINQAWGEVWIGQTEPIQNDDYNADDGASSLMRAFHFWDCGSTLTYDGLASAAGCDPGTPPNQIEITTTGTYYLIFRSGGQTYGTTDVVIDNLSLIDVTPTETTDASLSDLQVDGMTISGFASGTTSYNYDLTFGTTTVPTVTATTTAAGATTTITPASGIPGTTVVTVTSQDMSTTMDYMVSFTATIPNVDATDPTYSQVDVNALYSDTYTPPANPNYNPAWGQTTVMSEQVINANNTIKYEGLNYQGITFDQMDVSGRQYLHFDYWTGDGTQFRASPISASAGEVAYIISAATQNQWVSVDIPLTYFTDINAGFSFADIHQFKFDTETFDGNGQGAGNNSLGFSNATFYIDNLYFYTGMPLGVNEFEISGLNIYPNPTNNTWYISTKNETIQSIDVFDLMGNRVISLKPNALKNNVDASSLAPGMYVTNITTESRTVSRKLIKQ